MPGKTSKQFFFEVKLNWLKATRGVLTTKDADDSVYVGMPPAFGGEGKSWTPEHLFLGSISSCFMTTYLAFAKKLQFKISNLECDVIGQIEVVSGKYKFTTINVYPKVYIADKSLREKANAAVEKTHKYCLITNSINADVFYHTTIHTEEQHTDVVKEVNNTHHK